MQRKSTVSEETRRLMKMNAKETIQWRNYWLQKLDWNSRRHLNCIRFSDNETYDHVRAKVEVILGRKNPRIYAATDHLRIPTNKIDFLTEIISADRKFKADIIILNPELKIPDVIEIAKNETEESLQKKRTYWENQGMNFEVITI